MLATLTEARFSDPGWVFERKWDGVRCLAFRTTAGAVRLAAGTAGLTDPQTARATGIPAYYYVFDLLRLDGYDVEVCRCAHANGCCATPPDSPIRCASRRTATPRARTSTARHARGPTRA